MSEAMSEDDPIFLTLDEVLQIHEHQIETYGGDAGIRDIGLLDSAIAQPRQTFNGQFVHPDMASMAAAYLFHIASNHAFVDGNKRTGVHASLVFLGLNDIEVDVTDDELESITLDVAKGQADKDKVTEFFRRLLKDA